MGLELEMQWTLKRYNKNMDLELDPDSDLTPTHDLRWNIDGPGDRDGVDPKLRSKSYNTNMDLVLDLDPELNPPKLTSFCIHMVIKTLDGSSCKKFLISTSATYIWHTCEKVKKNRVYCRQWNSLIVVIRNTYQFNLWRILKVYIKQ